MKNHENILKRLNSTLSIWLSALDDYELETLLLKPDEESWSLGQVYVHLIDATLRFHLKQVEKCLSLSENSDKNKNIKGFVTFQLLGSIPPIKVKVPPSESYTPKQPISKEQIREGLYQVKEQMAFWCDKLGHQGQGKTTHPAFSYLSGDEWYRLVEMHFRHHLRQKNRIDAFLKVKR